MDMLVGGVGGIASRTPVNLGEVVLNATRKILPEYELMNLEHTPKYLVFGLWRQVGYGRYTYIVIMGERYRGLIAAEVATNIRPRLPYYRWSDKPQLGTFGFRERVGVMISGFDYSHSYRSQMELERVIRDVLIVYCGQAVHDLGERVAVLVEKSRSTWQPLYEEWRLAEEAYRDSHKGGSLRYDGLSNEEEVRNFILRQLEDERVVRFLGTLKSNYKDSHFLNCHTFLMARGLEFLDGAAQRPADDSGEQVKPSRLDGAEKITWDDIMGDNGPKEEESAPKVSTRNMGEPFDDLTMSLTGRLQQSISVKFSDDPKERHWQYCFYKTLSVMEGIYVKPSFGGFFDL